MLFSNLKDWPSYLIRPAAFEPPPVHASESSPPKLGFLSNKTSLVVLSLICLALLFLLGKEYFQKSSTNVSSVKTGSNARGDGEVPKDIKKEVMPRSSEKVVSKEVPKEIPKPVAKEIPKEVPKGIVKEVAEGGPKEPSKKAGKVISQASVKTDQSEPAQGPDTSAEAERIVSLSPPPFTEEEVMQFFSSYLDRYHRKDLDRFLSSFSSKAVQNQKEGFEGIRKTYANLFDQSQELQYRVEGMKIEIYRNWAEVKARFSLDQTLRNPREEGTWKGSIRWVLVKEDGNPKILSLDYEDEKSP